MNLKYLKMDKIAELEVNIQNNINKYINGELLVEDNDYLESRLKYSGLTLLHKEPGNNNDVENSKRVYETFKHLTLLEASDERIWVGLAHTEEIMKYIINRWNITEKSTVGSIKDRFFSNIKRNSISRLWWYGYLSHSEELENPYTLTEILAGNHDLAEGLLGRKFGRNKDIILTFLKAIHEWTELENQKFPGRDAFRNILKDMNRMSGITLMDMIDVDDITELLIKHCNLI